MRVRLRFTKAGKIRFTSHRDVARMWERALRRAELPMAYSEGFSPRPKVHFGLALSTGYESRGEYLDVDLLADARDLDVAALPERLSATLPEGIEVEAALEVSPGTASLQSAVTSCTWRLEVLGADALALSAAVGGALDATALPATRVRKGQEVTDDLRPYVLDLAVVGALPADAPPAAEGGAERGAVLVGELGTQPRTLRPSELVGALRAHLREGRVCRTHQWMQHDGARREPLTGSSPPEAPSAPLVERRAS